MKLIVRCVSCKAEKDASGHRGQDPPLCEKCYMPMLPVKATR